MMHSDLSDLLPEPMMVLDPKTSVVLDMNRAARRQGWVRMGEPLVDQVVETPALHQLLTSAASVRALLPCRLTFSADPERVSQVCRAGRLYHHDNAAVLLRIELPDLQDRMERVQRDLEVAQARLRDKARYEMMTEALKQERQSRVLGNLVGGLAHDFNNLLVGVIANLAMLRSDAHDHQALDEAESAARQAAALCRQLLAYGGQGQVLVRRLDLGAIARDEIGRLSAAWPDANLSVLSPVPGCFVEADEGHMRQAIQNLAINALEATEGRGKVRVEVASQHLDHACLSEMIAQDVRAGRYVGLSVVDDGPGIPADVRSKILEPYVSTRGVGRGLGLPAVVGITRAHRGAFQLSTRPGETTRITLWIPAADAVTAPPESLAPLPPGARDVVLVVDDEPVVRRAADRALRHVGWRVLQAEDGVQAVEVFERHRHEIQGILMDYTMPRRRGDEAARAIRKLDPGVPILLTSGYADTVLGDLVGAGVVSAFLSKPWSLSQLVDAARAAFADPPRAKAG